MQCTKDTTEQAILVSVLMPAYNHDQYIERAMNSVCCQTYQNVELIIVDDCSTDQTYNKALAKSNAAPIRIDVSRNERNLGISGTFERALALSRGNYICFLASDDAYAPEFVATCLDCIEQSQGDEDICVHTNAYIMDENGKVTGIYLDDSGLRPLEGKVFWDLLGQERFAMVSSTLFLKKRLLLAVGGFDKALKSEDYDLHLRLSRHARFEYIDAPLFYARYLNGSLGRRPWLYSDSALLALEKHADAMGDRYKEIMRLKTYGSSWSCFVHGSFYHGVRLFRKGLTYSSPTHTFADITFLIRGIVFGYGRHLAVSGLPTGARIAIQNLKKKYRRHRKRA
jgi:glycosyltransferase involved in cell wall biosynthesis